MNGLRNFFKKILFWLKIGFYISLLSSVIGGGYLLYDNQQLILPHSEEIIFATLSVSIVLFLLSRLPKSKRVEKKLSKIDKMEGHEFEEFAAKLFRKQGYKTHNTPYSKDQGADLIIEKRKVRAVVQVKRYSKKVNNSAIQEAFTAKAFYSANTAIVFTNNFFTNSAKELAKANNVILMDRDDIRKILVK